MVSTIQNHYSPDTAQAPGETLQGVLDERGITQSELARRMGRPLKTINEIIKGKAMLTPDTALQLELTLGIPAAFWNGNETRYREFLARQSEEKRMEKHVQWLREQPLKMLLQKGWVKKAASKTQQVREFLQFFGAATPETCKNIFPRIQVGGGAAHPVDASALAVLAWLRKGEQEARQRTARPFDGQGFRQLLKSLRSLTRESPQVFPAVLQQKCAERGVSVVYVPDLPGLKLSVASWWLSSHRAVILLSHRHKSTDALWFSFFHAAGHILLHRKKELYLDQETAVDDQDDVELEADHFAAEQLVPGAFLQRFRREQDFSTVAIERFARELDVAPGIVVIRLQLEGVLAANATQNRLKQSLVWEE